jgi:hypothetical protein
VLGARTCLCPCPCLCRSIGRFVGAQVGDPGVLRRDGCGVLAAGSASPDRHCASGVCEIRCCGRELSSDEDYYRAAELFEALQEMEQVVVFYNPAATATSTHHTIAAPLPLIPFPPFLSAYLTSFTILQLQQRLQQHQRQQEHNSDAGAAELAPDHQRRRIGMRPANEIVNFFRRFPVQKRTVRAITLTYTLALARTFPAKSRPVCFTCVPTRT